MDSVARRANGCRRCIDAPKVAATRERSKNGNERNRRFPSRTWKFNLSLSLSLSSISNHGGERKKSQSRNLEFFARTSEKKRIERDGFWKPRNHLSSSWKGEGGGCFNPLRSRVMTETGDTAWIDATISNGDNIYLCLESFIYISPRE